MRAHHSHPAVCAVARHALCLCGHRIWRMHVPHTSFRCAARPIYRTSTARRLSPVHAVQRLGVPVTVAWGGLESDEFRRQSRAMAEAAAAAGAAVTAVELPGINHFDILLELARPDTALAGLALAAMGLARGG